LHYRAFSVFLERPAFSDDIDKVRFVMIFLLTLHLLFFICKGAKHIHRSGAAQFVKYTILLRYFRESKASFFPPQPVEFRKRKLLELMALLSGRRLDVGNRRINFPHAPRGARSGSNRTKRET
jgi:hypothetical protein